MNKTSPLLTAKLHIPAVRPDLVARPRLLRKLDQGLTRPLTLISAPPGFGKTTLLSAWVGAKDHVAWLSLDEHDNDIIRFMTYLIAALGTVQPEVGRQALNRLRSRRKGPIEAAMTFLSNDIAGMPEFVLVLDDYHVIELQLIHEAMTFLLDRIPSPLHLVIATRADPPFPLARLRARDQLVELRAPDLRSTLEEAAAFLNERMKLGLTAEQVAALEARAEGWVAGLQLAALSMQGQQDIAGFVSAFAGSHHFVLDYLAEEVLARQSPEIQTFLLETSILDQMNAALADAVVDWSSSRPILEYLERANLFIVPLDDTRQWYRYHHLFDDLLQSRLQQSHPELIPELHRRASVWYEQNGFSNEAIEHALAIPDFDRAARLIEQVGLMFVMRSEVAILTSWTTRLPEAVITSRPLLALVDAAALTTSGKLDLGAARLAQVDDAALDPTARAVAALLRPVVALLRADIPHAIESAREALEAGEALYVNSSDPQAELNIVATAYMAVVLAELQIAAGQLRSAEATCRRGLQMGSSIAPGSPWGVILGFVHYELAELAYEWNEIAEADQHATTALEICRAGGNEEIEAYALVALALVKQVQGDEESAGALIQQAARLEQKRRVASELRYVAPRLARVLLAQGRIEQARRFVDELPAEDETVLEMFERGLTPVARALVLIAQREYYRVVRELEPLQQQTEKAAQIGKLIEVLTLLAVARQKTGDTTGARSALARALALAEPDGYIRTFVDLGESMRSMISDLGFRIGKEGDSPSQEYMNRLLTAFPSAEFGRPDSKSQIINPKSEILEPLSERELAVLRLIAEGLSNQEIADRLVVAVSTVKTHINNIYGKLGAGSRIQAVERARERGLLPLRQ